MSPFTSFLLLIFMCAVVYLAIGLLVLSQMDNTDRFYPITKHIEGLLAALVLLVWPLGVTWLVWRTRRRA